MTLTGPLGLAFGLAFIGVWAYAVYCAAVVVKNSNAKVGRWFGTFWPAHTLTPRGLQYRRRYYMTVLMGFALAGLAFLVFPR